MDILDALAIELCRLIELERFARLSGYFGDRCYVFGQAIKAAEEIPTSLPLPSVGRNGSNYVLMIKVQLDQSVVAVSMRVSIGTSITRYSDWYNTQFYDLNDLDLFSNIMQDIKDASIKRSSKQ